MLNVLTTLKRCFCKFTLIEIMLLIKQNMLPGNVQNIVQNEFDLLCAFVLGFENLSLYAVLLFQMCAIVRYLVPLVCSDGRFGRSLATVFYYFTVTSRDNSF